MATVQANKILTKFMLLLGGHNHCVKVSSDSETVRGMGLWEFSGALRELMLSACLGRWGGILGGGGVAGKRSEVTCNLNSDSTNTFWGNRNRS